MRDETARPQLGQIFAGKYLLTRLVGSGKASIVFAARHHVTGKRFAIRWFLPGFDARATPAGVVGNVRHANVLEVFDVGQHGGSYFAVLDWSEGEALDARVKRVGPVPVPDACRLLLPCLRAMHEAHAAGIVHGDLKPASIYIFQATRSTPEIAKLLDFQVEELASVQPDADVLATCPGPTLHYRAPEQLAGRRHDHRADVYAFGAVLHDVWMGMPHAATAKLPPGAAEVIERATAPNPADRFQSLAELANALEALGGSSRPAVAKAPDRVVVEQPTQFLFDAPPPKPRPMSKAATLKLHAVPAAAAPPKLHFAAAALTTPPLDPPSVYPTEIEPEHTGYDAPRRRAGKRLYLAGAVAIVATLAYIAIRDDTAIVTGGPAAAPPLDGAAIELDSPMPVFVPPPQPEPPVQLAPRPSELPPPAAVGGVAAEPVAPATPLRLPLRPLAATPSPQSAPVPAAAAPRLRPTAPSPAPPPRRARATRRAPEPPKSSPEQPIVPREPPDMRLL